LRSILQDLAKSPPPLVVLGSGNRGGFGYGWHFSELIETANNESFPSFIHLFEDCLLSLFKLSCPIIPACSGPCLGKALELALWCDFRIIFSGPGSQIGFHSFSRSWLPLPISLHRLGAIVGSELAASLIVSRAFLTPAIAIRCGLFGLLAFDERRLRNSVVLFRKESIVSGKRKIFFPSNLIRKLLECNGLTYKWINRVDWAIWPHAGLP